MKIRLNIKKILALSVSLILVIILAAFVHYDVGNKLLVLSFNDIKSVRIQPQISGPIRSGEIKSLYFDLNKREQVDMVKNILVWLKDGKVMRDAQNEGVSNGGTPTYLIITLKNGTEITIKSSTSVAYSDGTVIKSLENTDGQVTVYGAYQDGFRVLAPKLRIFIDNGWKEYFND